MVRRAWKTITNNFGLKLLAAVFAVILWLVVVNIDDPKISQRFTVSVVIENEDYLTDQGKYYEVLDNTNSITFTVTAKRSYMEKLSNTDFKAVANMENALIDSENGTAKVPIEVSALRYSSQVTISKATQNLEISLDELAQEQFIISVETVGTVSDDCALGDVSVSPNLLTVSGPQSLVSRIDHVVASIDVTGMTESVATPVVPVLYDSDGNTIDKSELTLNLSTVTVTAKILDIKDVSLIFNVTGTPASGYTFIGMEYEPRTIAIKGSASALNSVTAVTIPESALDISGARDNITQIVDVSEYLPSGVSVVDASEAKVTVTLYIAELATKTFNLFTSGIEVLNLPEGYELSFNSALVRVTLNGIAEELDALDTSSIAASIDASQLTPGTHQVEVALELDEGITHETVTITVTVSEPGAEETGEEENQTEETDEAENNGNEQNSQEGEE